MTELAAPARDRSVPVGPDRGASIPAADRSGAPARRVDGPVRSRALGYVPALDGLRGLAVVAVVLYHFTPWLMPGGFLGVDAFFVVSGFLIARLLVADLGVHGRVRLGRFWARRVRRLLPAALSMLFVVTCAALVVLSTVQLHELRDQLLASVAYGANWMLIVGKTSYFATLQAPSPLMHMWSLAVEEQFYLLFPLVLVALTRPLRSGWRLTTGLLLLAAVASTVWMAWLYHGGDPSRVYYGTDTHAMGLLLGAALGVMSLAPRRPSRATSTRTTTNWGVGAALVAFVAVLAAMASVEQDAAWLYRGGFLVFSAVCGVVVWSVVHAPRSRLALWLSSGALVAIGLRSYALYLWHWPVRVFVSTDTTGLHGYQLTVVRIIILVALAEASYQLVERTFRTGTFFRRFGTRSTIIYAAALSTAIIVLATFTMSTSLPPTSLAAALHTIKRPAAAPVASARVVHVSVFGDSTAFQFAVNGLNRAQDLPGLSIDGSAALGCSIVDGNHVSDGRIVEQNPDCAGWQQRWHDKLASSPPDAAVLMIGAWEVLDHTVDGHTVTFGTPEWTALVQGAVDDAITTLRAAGKPVFVFDVPCYPNRDAAVPLPERSDPTRIKALNTILHHATDGVAGVHLVNYSALVCPNGQHLDTVDGTDIWDGDGVHLNEPGAVFVWRWLLPQITPFLSSHQS